MKITKKLLLIIMVMMLAGCTNDYSEKKELVCDGTDQAFDCFYSNENDKYCFATSNTNYLKIGKDKIEISKAIAAKKADIDEIISLAKIGKSCTLYKINKETDDFIEIIRPYVEKPTVVCEKYKEGESSPALAYYMAMDGNYHYKIYHTCKGGVFYENSEYSYGDALIKGLITFEELKEAGVIIERVKRAEIIQKDCNTSNIIKVWNNSYYDYYVDVNCYGALHNGKEYGIVEALNDRIITIDELIEYGLIAKKVENGLLPIPD